LATDSRLVAIFEKYLDTFCYYLLVCKFRVVNG
jgi:hypothetical protein